ncbi:MAG: hypothetical protein ACI4GD_01425 [Lachnospiraceae bacterium]
MSGILQVMDINCQVLKHLQTDSANEGVKTEKAEGMCSMKSIFRKTVKYLVLLLIIAVVVRIAYVNLTSKNIENVVSQGDVITYNNLDIKLKEANAAFVDDMYRIEFELEIENNTDETQEFAYYLLAAYSEAISNGVIPCNNDGVLINVEPRKTVTARYYTDIYRNNLSDKSWQKIDKKDFKLLLLEYENNTGWQVNPEECDIKQLAAANEEKNDDDGYKLIYMDADEFYKTQFVTVGETVNCLWNGIKGGYNTFIDMTVDDVMVSKEITAEWQYVLGDVKKYSVKYTSFVSKIEVADNRIVNSYSAVKVKVRIDAKTEARFAISDLMLYHLNNDFYPVKEEGYSYFSGIFGADDNLEFIKYDMNGGFTLTDEYTRTVALKEGINELTLVYIVPDSILESYDEVYLESGFIGYSSADNKETHCYSNESALIKCPLK